MTDGNLDLFGGGGAEKPKEGPPPIEWRELDQDAEEHEGHAGEEAAGASAKPDADGVAIDASVAPALAIPAKEQAFDEGIAGEVPEPRVWKVSQINKAVKILLQESFPKLWISGEVTNFTRTRAGHCYFSLKDESAQLNCVMFRQDAERLPMNPDEGMTLKVYGDLTLYESRGTYQMVVTRADTEGSEGLWKLAFERVRKKLEAEGLMDLSRKRPIPKFPRRVGVVTSPTGAALRDIVSVVGRRAPWVRLVLRGARVQGGAAADEIAQAIRVMAEAGDVDVIIVGRGGGSMEDLWGFNEEVVARAIAECPIPIISAVGHEVDVTISDLVADLRSPTPSAGAEAAVPELFQVRDSLVAVQRRLGKGLGGQVERRRWRLDRVNDRLFRSGRGMTAAHRSRRDRGLARLGESTRQLIQSERLRLAELGAAMEALSPLSTLARGYAVPLDGKGHVLRGVDEFLMGSSFSLRVVDGRVACRVDDDAQEEL